MKKMKELAFWRLTSLIWFITCLALVISFNVIPQDCEIVYNELPAEEIEYVDLYMDIDDINLSNPNIYTKNDTYELVFIGDKEE